MLLIAKKQKSLNADQTCTGPNEYIDKKTGNCTMCPTTCPPGYGYFEYPCGYGTMKTDRCYPCEDGETYSAADDSNRCYPCNPCHNHEKIKNCTVTANAECPACVHGYGWDQFRAVCKDCEHARRELPGCEKPPEVMVTEHRVHRAVCKNVPEQSLPDQYSWFLDDEILDTSDENKFVLKGNKLLILDPDVEDYGVYTCRAEWNANEDRNFDIMKMSSNKVETFPTEEHGEIISEDTVTEHMLSTKKECIDDNDGDAAKTVINCHPCLHHWISWIIISIICLLLPNAWFYNKVNCKSKYTTGSPSQILVYQTQTPLPTQHIPTHVPLLRPEPQNLSLHEDVESAKTLGHIQELKTSNQMDYTDDHVMVTQVTEEKCTRQPEEKIENIYKKTLGCSSGLYYHELDVETIDWLTLLLNPHKNPDPPIKYWIHLASKLGTDQATINSLGTYKRFHEYLFTKDVSMQIFLEALWTVGNHQATKVVCKAVMKMHKNRN
ncbi:uncharacterized protein LOC117123169 isoform X2 [Anneissia japonica]|uniref:uncharacterized protein LOC117123169 isoform X2 n=1 Tax=Anneissia japonica TaxID=1529436 RepID=UPI00142555A4|nr:uncharacterized protein LOC117123169 isoform X2 [Anneissia japonica]